MSRAWKQFDRVSNRWVDWPAGTLPSPESVFRAAFLNQFVSWRRYLNDCTGRTKPVGFISPGDEIQSAAFWNGFCVNLPTEFATAQDVVVGTPVTLDRYLYQSQEFISVMNPVIAVGDVLQLRTHLSNLRAQMDMCKNIRLSILAREIVYLYFSTYKYPYGHVQHDYGTFGAYLSLFSEGSPASQYSEQYSVWSQLASRSHYITIPQYVLHPQLEMTVSVGHTTYNPTQAFHDPWHVATSFTQCQGPAYLPTMTIPVTDCNPSGILELFYSQYESGSPSYHFAEPPTSIQLLYYAYGHPLDTPPSEYKPSEYPFPL